MLINTNFLTDLKQSSFIVLLLCAVVLSVISKPAYAQISEFKITASDGAEIDQFGTSVSISGDYAVVGAWLDDDNGDNSGSAYIYMRSGTTWSEQAKLLSSDGAANDRFGFSVSISGDYAVVGAWLDDDNGDNSGSAYIFKRTGTSWAQEAKLLPSGGAAIDFFGFSVSISGDYAVVGSYQDDDNGSNSGSAYIFKRTGTSWAQEAKLLSSDGARNDRFGRSVSISGDYAVVGAYLDDDNGTSSGSAYVFKRTGTSWAQEAKLLPADGAASDNFGTSVSISGDYAAIGANLDGDNGSGSGSAYIFKRSGTSWAQEAKLLPSDGAANDLFGMSVSISGDNAVVGAQNDDDNGDNSGSAYVFKRGGTTWAQEAKLLASDGAEIDQFGTSVSISGDYAVLGANGDDDNGFDAGSAYIFDFSVTPNIPPVLDFVGAKNINEGETLNIFLTGSDDDGDTLSFSATGMPLGMTIDPVNGNVSYSPDFEVSTSAEDASFSVTFTVSDGNGGTDSETLLVSVVNVNLFPILSPIGAKEIMEGATLSFTLASSDADGDVVAYSATGLPSGMTLNSVSGEVSYSPDFDVSTNAENTTFSVTFTVSDGNGGSDEETIVLTVINYNKPPELNPVGAKNINEGETLEFTLTAFDADGDPLVYSATGLPTGMTLNPTSGVVNYTPAFDVSTSTINASFNVTFSVSDGVGSISEVVLVTVLNVIGGTPTGTEIVVQPQDGETGGNPVTATYSEVTSSGLTSLTLTGTGPEPPSGFDLGTPTTYYSVTTTAGFTSPIEVCVNYTGLSFDSESGLVLSFYEDGEWVDHTSSVDTENNVICAVIDGFSLFAIFEPLPGTIAGTVSVNIVGLANVTVELLDLAGAAVDGFAPIKTNTGGEYFFEEVVADSYQVIIVEPLGYIVDINPVLAPLSPGATTTADFALTEVVLTNEARGKGYWKHQFNVNVDGKGKAQESAEQLSNYIGRVHEVYTPHFDVFSGMNSLEDWQSVLTVKRKGSKLDKATEQLAALVLNFASLKIGQYEVVTDDGRTAGDVLTFVSLLILDGDASNDNRAKELAELVNTHQEISADLIPTGGILFKSSGGIDWSFAPTDFALHNNYPNPFNPVTTLSYDLPISNNVRIVIYNLMGQEVRRWEIQGQAAGAHKVIWDASNVASGVYIYRLQAGSFVQTRKMILLK